MYQKRMGLAKNVADHTKIYAIESKIVILFLAAKVVERKRGAKNGTRLS
jgi:hypothetical protein